MIQTVKNAQELYAKAALVDHEALDVAQGACELIDAEECLKKAFRTDVTPALESWRKKNGLAPDPLKAFRKGGYLKQVTEERAAKNAMSGGSYA
jgi:L-rhamnose isomerase/sugar isomerase